MNLTVLVIAIFIGAALLEVLSRLVFPIVPAARDLMLDGTPVGINSPTNPYRHREGLKFRQVSSEFDVTISITQKGHRAPSVVGNPDTVFLGDSFTFGQGLDDEDTFPSIYCAEASISCANLGRNGTGTGDQIDILEHYLESEGWKPRQVILVMLVMSTGLAAGNDFLDNILHSRKEKKVSRISKSINDTKYSTSSLYRIVKNEIIFHSNLFRLTYFYFAPWLRLHFTPEIEHGLLDEAAKATRIQLNWLQEISDKYGFQYRIFVAHPIQDILRGTHSETINLVRRLAPAMNAQSTAPAFISDPHRYYYAYDGHFNRQGSLSLAKYLSRELAAGN